MSAETTKLKRRFRSPLSSIGAKLTLVLLALGAAAVMISVVASLVFQNVARDMDRLTHVKLPALELSNRMTAASSSIKDAMTKALLVETLAELDASESQISEKVSHLRELVSQMPEETRSEFSTDVETAAQSLEKLVMVKRQAFRNQEWIQSQVADLQSHSTALQNQLSVLAGAAYEHLSTGGNTTISSVGATLDDLVNVQFGALQTLLETQANINMMSGVALAIGTEKDAEIQNLLRDIGNATSARLATVITQLEVNEALMVDVEILYKAADSFGLAVLMGAGQTTAMRRDILKARAASSEALNMALDDMVISLSIAASEASDDNKQAIQDLLNNEVGVLRALLEFNGWLGEFQLAALTVVGANTTSEVRSAAPALQEAANYLAGLAELDQSEGMAQSLAAFAAMADPEQGLAAFKQSALQANEGAMQASHETAAAVLQIASRAVAAGSASQADIASMAQKIESEITSADTQMRTLLAVAAGVLIVSLFLTRLLIQRPLRRISQTTERLAQGDLAPVTGFERAGDEIYRIAQALSVFRNGLAEREESNRLIETERAERQAEQDAAVTAIGAGLASMSQGDLSARITQQMSGGYQKLADDFNTAIKQLSDSLSEILNASNSIHTSSTDIQRAADDLSQRTENQAAALEETAAALQHLGEGVSSAASGTRNVETSMQSAKAEAEKSTDVMNTAVGAMSNIEDSSKQIAQIVNVIDDIAFQTNLLALNAGVEAARAGEAGKGFAVVASEVRALAQRSSESALEIKSLITASSDHVERGVDLVSKAGESLGSIQERIGEISTLMTEIAEIASDQSHGLNEINTSMDQLDKMTQQNAGMVVETTGSATQLNQHASKLAHLAGQFSHSAPELDESDTRSAA